MTTLYKTDRHGKLRMWTIIADEDIISTTWGVVDGKMQTTSKQCPDCGVAGHADYCTPEDNAANIVARKLKLKKESGWTDTHNTTKDAFSYNDICKFAKKMCFYKPQNSIKDKKYQQLVSKNTPMYLTEKRNGMMHIMHKDNASNVKIYTRRMDDATARFPFIQEWAEFHLPNDTLLLGEMVVHNEPDPSSTITEQDDFQAIARICRSKPKKAVARQIEENIIPVFLIFDALWIDGEALGDIDIIQRMSYVITMLDSIWYYIIEKSTELNIQTPLGEGNGLELKMLTGHNTLLTFGFIDYIDSTTFNGSRKRRTLTTLQEIKAKARAENLEGYVLWAIEPNTSITIEQLISFNGKPKRLKDCWKVKPKYEDDFIAKFDPDSDVGGFYKQTDRTMLGKVALYELDKDGNEQYVCDCGGGLSQDQRARFVSLTWPRIWTIEYDRRGSQGGLIFPIFLRDRTTDGDKLSLEE